MRDNVILIGFMGAGKTSVGKALSESAGMALADTDCMIETEAGMSVSDIFASRGEIFFREMETAILKSLLDKAERTIICAGGGLPLREENRDRRQLYKMIAEKNNQTREVIAARAAIRFAERAKTGEYLMQNGEWRKKQ